MPRWYDFDINRDGIADWRQGWLYRIALNIIANQVRRHAPSHTVAARVVDDVQAVVNIVLTEEGKPPPPP